MLKIGVLCTLCIGVGAGIGWSSRSTTSTGNLDSCAQGLVESQPARPIWGSAVASAPLDATQLRAVIREELAAARSDKGGDRDVAAIAAVSQPPASAATLTERREAMQSIDSMVASGQWGNEERFGFQQRLMKLDPQQAELALQKVLVALNTGAIRVHTDGPPL
jgi:hypothetical protein